MYDVAASGCCGYLWGGVSLGWRSCAAVWVDEAWLDAACLTDGGLTGAGGLAGCTLGTHCESVVL